MLTNDGPRKLGTFMLKVSKSVAKIPFNNKWYQIPEENDHFGMIFVITLLYLIKLFDDCLSQVWRGMMIL